MQLQPAPRPDPVAPANGRAAADDMQAYAGDAAALLRLLANEQRLMILCHLVPGELAVGELASRLSADGSPLSQSALSQHLGLLRDAGLLSSRREGLRIYYGIVPGPACEVLAVLHAIYCGRDG